MIYLDNAATTMHKPACVLEAVREAMSTFGNSGRAVHDGALKASRGVYGAREAIARFFCCPKASHVVFTFNATEALNTALFGLFSPGDHVISTDLEHNSVLRPLYALQERGVAVDFCPADSFGRIDYGDFQRFLNPHTKAIVCTHGSNLTGDLLDLAWIGRFATDHGLLFVVDASQTAGAFPIDMGQLGIDVLCFTGHKSLMGPQGTGGLCIGDADIRPLKMGGTGVQTYLPHQPGELPARLEAGTLNGHGIAGLAAAIDFLEQTGIETIRAHESMLTRRFYAGVSQIDGVYIYGDFTAPTHAPIVSLNLRDIPSGEVGDALAEDYGIAVRTGAHCAPRLHRALGTVRQGAVRFSFGYYNTTDDVDSAVEAIRSLAK